MKNIILASSSQQRENLLKNLLKDFEIKFPSIKEEAKNLPAEEVPVFLAFQKAKQIFDNNKDSVVIGADTICCIGENIFGKPSNETEAFETLKLFRENLHTVITGVCIISNEKTYTFSEISTVLFDYVDDEQLKKYIKQGTVFKRAGSYGLQDNIGAFISKINGDYYNVLGLPLNRLRIVLKHEYDIKSILD